MMELSFEEKALIYASVLMALHEGWAGKDKDQILREILAKLLGSSSNRKLKDLEHKFENPGPIPILG